MQIPPGVRRAFRLPDTTERLMRELDDEVRFHVEMRIEQLVRQGMPREQAVADALHKFGDVADLRAYCHSIEVSHMQRMESRERFATLAQDFRFAVRQYLKSPAFAFVAALTLALGIGATTAIFSVVNGVVLRPLPFRSSEQIVRILGVQAKGPPLSQLADPTFAAIVSRSRSFTAVAEYHSNSTPVTAAGEPVKANIATVSAQYFPALGVTAGAGRLFLPEEQQLGASMSVVVSSGFAEREFGSAAAALGKKLTVETTPATIVGVLPPGQEYPAQTDAFVPRELEPTNSSYTAHNWRLIARMRPGISVEQAQADVSTILRSVHQEVGDQTWTLDGTVMTLRDQVVGRVRPLLMMLFAASAVLLVIACANVANLLIARMASRQGEVALRMAIGASRGRLVQQLLIEALLLAAVGCVGGLALAFAGVKVLLALRPSLVPRLDELGIDTRVLVFAVGISALTAVVLGLLAAWRGAGADIRETLSNSQRTQAGSGSSYRLRGALVVAQIAMTVVLLIGAGLLARSFVQLMTVDAGFRTTGVVVADVGFAHRDGVKGLDMDALRQEQEMLARVRSIPGVTAVGISDAPPFSNGSSNGAFLVLTGSNVKLEMESLVRAFREDKAHVGFASYRVANAGFFKALDIPLISGRLIDDRDRQGAPHVAVISQSLARKQWPNENPLGKSIEFGNIDGDLTPITIVGVVGDTREENLAEQPTPAVYLSDQQRSGNNSARYIVMATNGESATIAAARQQLRQVRSDVVIRFQTIEEIIAASVATQRFMLVLIGVFGATALLLATLGVYSVLSYLVSQRGKEISVRVALGATTGDVVRLIVKQGLTLALAGALIGAGAAIAVTRLLKTMLYEISTTDPIAYGGVVVVLCAIAAAASYVPARRASRIEPMDVLRAS